MKETYSIPSLFNHALEKSKNPPYSSNNKKGISIFLINDFFADADSIASAIDLLIAMKRKEEVHPHVKFTINFISSDEFNDKTLKNLLEYYTAKKEGFLQSIYQNQYDTSSSLSFPYRIQDTATVLFPIADILGLDISLMAGDVREMQNATVLNPELNVSIRENSNPYFGTFGKDFAEQEKKHVDRITPVNDCISKAFVEKVKEAQEKSEVFIINGGSLTLLSHLSEDRALAKAVNVILLAFNQPIFTLPYYSTTYSHNDSLNVLATENFLKNSYIFNNVEVIDSNTVHYCPSFSPDKEMKMMYQDYISAMGLEKIISPAAFKNLLITETRHFTKYGLNKRDPQSSQYTKFNDSVMVAYLTGDIHIPMVKSQWKRLGFKEVATDTEVKTATITSMVPSTSGFTLTMPYVKMQNYEGHPYSGSTTFESFPIELQQKNKQFLVSSLTTFFNTQATFFREKLAVPVKDVLSPQWADRVLSQKGNNTLSIG